MMYIKQLFLFVLLLSLLVTCKEKVPEKEELEGMILIPGGWFMMGSEDGHKDEKPVHRVWVDGFFIDKTEVTNKHYCEFLNGYEGIKKTEVLLDIYNKYCKINYSMGRYKPKPGYEYHPVVMVSRHGARVFARWCNKRLPTEAEWEYASRGGLEGKKYPWGDDYWGHYQPYLRLYNYEIINKMANYKGIGNRDKFYETSPVGSFPPNGYGLYDMAGNVWEYCYDVYSEDYYSKCPSHNPMGPSSGSVLVIRGGSYDEHSWYLRCAYRSYKFSESVSSEKMFRDVGFRCAKSLFRLKRKTVKYTTTEKIIQ